MQLYRLEKPNITEEDKEKANGFKDVMQKYNYIKRVNEPDYLFWDKARFIRPLPDGLTAEQAWFLVKTKRQYGSNLLDIKNASGEWFRLLQTEHLQKLCHEFDMSIGGNLLAEMRNVNDADRRVMIANGIIEEAIASSQLEGADTGRDFAEKIIREGMTPRTNSEQMIVNNHVTLKEIETSLSKMPMSIELLDEIHTMLTIKTLDDWGNTPHRRTAADEPLVVKDMEFIYHHAPEADSVSDRLPLLISYMNDNFGDYLHPVMKAAAIHFWIGYLHPYTEGNGRLARAIAHWYMLRHNYWGYSYLPLSAMLKEGGKKAYTKAYVYAEQDDYDMTYFISYLLGKMEDAVIRLRSSLEEKRTTSRTTVQAFLEHYRLNERLALTMNYLTATPDNYVTFASHMTGNRVARATAAKDFKHLTKLKLVKVRKNGRTVKYFASEEARKAAKTV